MSSQTQLSPSISILLVEDNPISSKIQAKMLEHKGFHVDQVDNGFDALAHVQKKQYQAIIMDINMPQLNGYETTAKIRNWEKQQGLKQIPVIALSANIAPDVEKYKAEGINFFIVKPLNDSAIDEIFRLTVE